MLNESGDSESEAMMEMVLSVFHEKDLWAMDGTPISMWESFVLRRDFQRNYQVKKTFIGHLRISTVLLNDVHGYDREERPFIFETALIYDGVLHSIPKRYVNKAHAIKGHRAIVREFELGKYRRRPNEL